jgi:hypothetical protein
MSFPLAVCSDKDLDDLLADMAKGLGKSFAGHHKHDQSGKNHLITMVGTSDQLMAAMTILRQLAGMPDFVFQRFSVVAYDPDSVDKVVNFITAAADEGGRGPLALLHDGSDLLIWGSDTDQKWVTAAVAELAQSAASPQTEVYWLRGSVDPEDVRTCLTRLGLPRNSWVLKDRRLEITAPNTPENTSDHDRIMDTLWGNDYLYTRLFKSLTAGNLDPVKTGQCKLPDIPNVSWRWDFAKSGLLVTGDPEASVATYSEMIYHDSDTDPNVVHPWDLVYNYPSDDIGDDDSPLPVVETARLYFARDPGHVADLLTAARNLCDAPDVSVAPDTASGALPGLVLIGPKVEIRNLKRALEKIDIQHPSVRLDVWSCQLSGNDALEVAQRAQEAQSDVDCVRRLVRGYVNVLTQYTTEIEQTNRLNLGRVTLGAAGQQEYEPFALITGSEAHMPSLAEVFITQMLTLPWGRTLASGGNNTNQPQVVSDVREQLSADLRKRFTSWITSLRVSDPKLLQTWLKVLKANPDRAHSTQDICRWFQQVADDDPSAGLCPLGLLPQRFLDMFNAQADTANVQSVLSRFLFAQGVVNDPDPDQTTTTNADAQAIVQDAMNSFADDLRELFLDPLVEDLREIASTGDRYGLGSVSTTSLSVISESQATVVGAASTYFQAMPEPTPPNDLGSSLGGSPSGGGGSASAGFAPSAASSTGAAASTATPSATAAASTGAGTASPGSSGSSGLFSAAGALGPAQLAAIGLEAANHPMVWASMDEGAALTFLPRVLRGGSGAELSIDFKVAHPAPASSTGSVPPMSRVATNEDETTVYLQPLDLFSLSSFTMATTIGSRMEPMPLLGYLPLVGELFRYPSATGHVQHVSLLVVYSTVLPTANDWGSQLGVTPVWGIGPPGAPPNVLWGGEEGWINPPATQ